MRTEIHETKINESGRVIIPVSLRKYKGLRPGDKMLIYADEQGIHLYTPLQAARNFQHAVSQHIDPSVNLQEELKKLRREWNESTD